MSTDNPQADPARSGQEAAPAGTETTVLDQPFDADTLYLVRQTVLAYAVAAGLSQRHASDVMLAVHELAANAVRHGGGAGRLRMSVVPGALCYQVEDDGAASPDGQTRSGQAANPDGISERTGSWPYRPGHGLWLVRAVTDQISAISGPGGSRVTVRFALPAAGISPAAGDGQRPPPR